MNVDRTKTSLFKGNARPLEGAAMQSGAELLSFMWELTKEVYSLSGRYDVEQRLQRNVVRITRKQR